MYQYPRQRHIGMFALSEGTTGILQTAHLMRKLVHEYKSDPEIREKALGLVAHLPPKDSVAEITVIFNYVRDCIRYVGDIYDVETLHTPPEVIRIGQGDCDDKSTLLAALLESIGFQTAFKITAHSGPDYEHVYVFVRGGPQGVAMHLDPTEPYDAGWEPPFILRSMYVE